MGRGRTIREALGRSADYVKNPDKTAGGQLISGYRCNPGIVESEFLFSTRSYMAKTGQTIRAKDVIAYHVRQSFHPGEVTPELANEIGYELAMSLTKGKHAFIVCTHVDKSHVHSHIIFNSTSLDCDRKFRNFLGSSFAVRRISDILCLQHGLSIIEEPKPSRGSYGDWQGEGKKPTVRGQLESMLEQALQGCDRYDDFLARMQKAGAEVKTGKHLAFKPPGARRFIRCDSLSEDYRESAIRQRLDGKYSTKQNPASAKGKPAEAPFNPLIDIQKKMAQLNSPGFAHWAGTYNLKEFAKTVCYLSEHNLLQREGLNAACDQASEKYHALSDKLKANRQRMDEISTLQRHMGTYGKTKELYRQYRQLPQKKQADFYEAHRAELAGHEAAKKYFDSLHVQKLPNVQTLKQEYAILQAENRKLYPQQKEARGKMMELLTARSNLERFMNIRLEEPENQKPQQEAQR